MEVESDDDVDEDDEEISEDEAPKTTRRTNRAAAAPRFAYHVLSIASAAELSLAIRRRAREVLPKNLPKHRNRQH